MTKYIIVLPNGTEITSGADTVNAIASTTLTTATNSGTDLTLGSVCAAMAECTLITPGAGLAITAGDEITLYTENDIGSRTKVGLFAVEKPSHPSANKTKITAYDRVTRLDKDLTAWLGGLTGYPYTLKTFAQMVCTECGVPLENQNIPNGDFKILAKPTSAAVTGRQLMQWIAEIAGKFVTANANGNLEFGWYTDSGVTVEPDGDNYYFAGSLSYEAYTVAAVDAVKLRLAESEDGALWPAGDAANPYVTNNKLLLQHGTDIAGSVLATMLAAVNMAYKPCQIAVQAESGVKAGQIITIIDSNGTEIKTPVFEAVQSGQKIAVKSTGAATRSSAENLNSPGMQETAENAVAAQTQADIFSKLTNGGKAKGIYMVGDEVFINASYIKTGELLANLIKAGKIMSANETGSRFVLDLDNGQFYIESAVNGDELRKMYIDRESILISADQSEDTSENRVDIFAEDTYSLMALRKNNARAQMSASENGAQLTLSVETDDSVYSVGLVVDEYSTALTGVNFIDGLDDLDEDSPESAAAPKSYVDKKAPFVESSEYPGCYYIEKDGDTQWLNPPCAVGEEYLTTEYYLGEPVKVAVINCGTISGGATLMHPHDLSISRLVRSNIVVGRQSLPYLYNGDPNSQYSITGYVNKDNVFVKNGAGNGTYEVYAQIWYQ